MKEQTRKFVYIEMRVRRYHTVRILLTFVLCSILFWLMHNLADVFHNQRHTHNENQIIEDQMKKAIIKKYKPKDDFIVKTRQQKLLQTKKKVEMKTRGVVELCDDPIPGTGKVISYSLFGETAEGIGRFIKNVAEEAASIEFFKDFTIRIYVDQKFSEESRLTLRANHQNVRFCDIRYVPVHGDLSPMMGRAWRFVAMADATLDIFCSRDLDSPLLKRDADAVEEWYIRTNKILHVMRDRDNHLSYIMAGMWCFRNSKDKTVAGKIFSKIKTYSKKEKLHSRADQKMLNKHVWKKLKEDSLQHDAYLCGFFSDTKPFPTQRQEHFVGCVRNCSVYKKIPCPSKCRPPHHQDWEYC